MNIDTIKRETKKATQLQIRGKTIEGDAPCAWISQDGTGAKDVDQG